jgi:hypothetical protein
MSVIRTARRSSSAFDNADGLFEDVVSNTPSTSFRLSV